MNFCKLVPKLVKIGFSRNALKWMISYLSDREQYVQIDDKISARIPVKFGVPQGSVICPILFNLYVADMQDHVNSNIAQYADDTTLYEHITVSKLTEGIHRLNNTFNELDIWSKESDLLLNPTKTNIMLFSTKQMSRLIICHYNESLNGNFWVYTLTII